MVFIENSFFSSPSLSFEFEVDNDFIKTIYPITKNDGEIKIEGRISTVKNNSRVNLYVPFFSYKDINIIGLNLKIDTKEVNYPAINFKLFFFEIFLLTFSHLFPFGNERGFLLP